MLQNISRRTALKAITGTAVAAPLALETSCFNANEILTDINVITADAEKVVTAVQGSLCTTAQTSSCIGTGIFASVDAWLTALQTANTTALAIDAGAATLTAAQIADIAVAYAQVVVVNIPGLPADVQLAISAAETAIQILLSLIGTAKSAAFKSKTHAVPISISGAHLASARHKNEVLKSHIHGMESDYRAAHKDKTVADIHKEYAAMLAETGASKRDPLIYAARSRAGSNYMRPSDFSSDHIS